MGFVTSPQARHRPKNRVAGLGSPWPNATTQANLKASRGHGPYRFGFAEHCAETRALSLAAQLPR